MKNWIRQLARKFKTWRHHRLVKKHFGTEFPESVQLTGSTNTVFLDPHDRRAYKVLLAAPLRGRVPRNQPFWREACMETEPTLALDVGVNYGECLFGPNYSAATEIHGFEANPALIQYLDQSRKVHPDGSRLQVHLGLVAEEPGPSRTFYIDREWSGGSSAVAGLRPTEPGRFEPMTVPVSSVDTLIGARPSGFGSVVFKIDVEGFEYRVLQGMRHVLATSTWSLGLLEFDPQLMQQAGDNLAEYWQFLSERFEIYAFDRGRQARRVSSDWSTVQAEMTRGLMHTDLIVVGGQPTAGVRRFLAKWTMSEPDSARRAA